VCVIVDLGASRRSSMTASKTNSKDLMPRGFVEVVMRSSHAREPGVP
jgi:hypothetical protein